MSMHFCRRGEALWVQGVSPGPHKLNEGQPSHLFGRSMACLRMYICVCTAALGICWPRCSFFFALIAISDSLADGCVAAALAWLVAVCDWLWEPVDDVWDSLGKLGAYWYHGCPLDLDGHLAGALWG